MTYALTFAAVVLYCIAAVVVADGTQRLLRDAPFADPWPPSAKNSTAALCAVMFPVLAVIIGSLWLAAGFVALRRYVKGLPA